MKKYVISAFTMDYDLSETCHFETDNPKTAINKWIAFSRKYPTCASITCGSKEDCLAIYKTFYDYRVEFEKSIKSSRFYYSFEWLLKGCCDMLSYNFSFVGDRFTYDQVPYFSYG